MLKSINHATFDNTNTETNDKKFQERQEFEENVLNNQTLHRSRYFEVKYFTKK